jgi:methionine synthase / methylenetetrahydrofolate reductase(NADPH)
MLCDGAMGTLLYEKGVFINRCYDELNLSQPDLIRGIHGEYLAAGAEIVETNTFGANSFRLSRHGLTDRGHDINLAGARLAKEAVNASKRGQNATVAGSIGPIGVRMEPLGKTSREEVRDAFRSQARSLAEGGVDIFMLETFGYLEEIHQAILACRDAAPEIPVVALVTIDEDGNCLDGSEPETFGAKLTEWGADVVGCNCSVGPVAMLGALERVRAVTDRPLAAQPNAGMPRSVDGRNIYLCSPEYMASYTRKFLAAGVRLVGGCCGTTPAHIKTMAASLRTSDAKTGRTTSAPKPPLESAVKPPALGNRSRIGARLVAGEFLTMVEIVPPKGINAHKEIEGARFLKSVGVDAINIPDSPRASARMSNMMLCVLVQQQVGIETVLHYTCRDRNVLGIQSDLLGVSAVGLKNILCITGDPPKMGNYPDATAVFDVDSIGLVNIASKLNHGLDIGDNPVGVSTGFTIGVGANPGAPDLDEEIRRFEYKVQAGAEYVITQPVFDLKLLQQFLRRIEHCRVPVIAGIWPLTSVRNAEFMKDELRVSVPDEIISRMAKCSSAESSRAEGVTIAREMLAAVRSTVQGAQVSAPLGRYTSAADVLEALGSTQTAKV